MKRSSKSTAVAIGIVAITVGAWRGYSAHAQIAGFRGPTPDQVRFRVIGDEPISSADGRALVNGLKVIALRDTKSDQCYMMFVAGSAISVTGPSVCP